MERAKQLVREIEALAHDDFFPVWDAAVKEMLAALERRGMTEEQSRSQLGEFMRESPRLAVKGWPYR